MTGPPSHHIVSFPRALARVHIRAKVKSTSWPTDQAEVYEQAFAVFELLATQFRHLRGRINTGLDATGTTWFK